MPSYSASSNAARMKLLSPLAPELVASAASAKIAVPSRPRACPIASSTFTSGACMRARWGQKPSTSSSASRSAASGSPSVTTTLCEHNSGTSVKGLPIIMPAVRAVPERSSSWARRIDSP